MPNDRIPIGPLWLIGDCWYMIGAGGSGGQLLVGLVGIDPETGPIGYATVPDTHLARIASFVGRKSHRANPDIRTDIATHLQYAATLDEATWKHRAEGEGNARSYLQLGRLRPCIAGGNRIDYLRHAARMAIDD